MHRLHSYAKTIGAVSESEDELSAFRVVALADVWNCAHSLDSIPSRVLDLERVSKLLVALDGGINARAATLNPEVSDNVISRRTDPRQVYGQVYDTAWILLRLLAEEVYENASATAMYDTSQKLALERVFSEFRVLYEYFTDRGEEAHVSASDEQYWIDTSSDEAVYRLMCTIVSKVGVVRQWPEAFGWWIQNAINLVANSSSPSNLSVAGIRLIRFALELLGDAVFDLDVIVGYSTGKCCHNDRKMVLGLDIQKILLMRVGNIVSPLPGTVATEPVLPVKDNDAARDQNAKYCVVIFRNELATNKLVDAANSVGEPDISSLEIPVDVGDGNNAVEKAVTEAVAECTAAQATMKHASVRCDGCNQSPLRGFRFKCFTCPNYDLCTACYMNQTHNIDHPFVRLTDTIGSGDLLQARSKGGGVVPETALVGSKPWKGNLLHVLLDSQGYVVYCSGSRHECCDSANALAQLGFLVSVAHVDDIENVNLLHDWESKVQFSFEPGSSRLSQRRSSTSADKGSSRRAGRDVINAFNRKATTSNFRTRRSGHQVEDKRAVASEVIAVLRLIVSSRAGMERWHSRSLQILTEVIEDAPSQLAVAATLNPTKREAYFVALGATQVLGGFRERLRVGGSVSMSSYAADKARGGHTGVVYSYAFGNDDIVIANVDATPDVSQNGETGNDDDICFCKRTSSEVRPISDTPLEQDIIQSLEPLVVPFCSVIKQIYMWTSEGENEDENDAVASASLLRWELACALMQSFSSLAPSWPSLFDNQVISVSGNIVGVQ